MKEGNQAEYWGADGILIIFDLSNKETFDYAKKWLEEKRKTLIKGEKVVIKVFGNKSDSQEVQVSDQEISKFEKETRIKVIKGSAKNGDGVKECI